jgi:UDP-sugar transporter A1/2/3
MPVAGGRRYITSTAVFLNEVIKLTVSLTAAMYEISKTVPPSMPATSLFTAMSAAVFSGDSWKLAIPAALYTLANSLQYIGISNLVAATFQVTYQLKLIATAVFGAALLRRSLPLGKWMALLLILAGVAVVQIPSPNPADVGNHKHAYFPRALPEWHDIAAGAAGLTKRSATYEGIEEDMMLEHPRLNTSIGLLATIGACLTSGLAGVSLEKVVRESTSVTSVWIRNVQLAIYSIFPSLFIGVVFFDGEKVARAGFFEGYNWIVWTAIGIQAIGGIASSFCISHSEDVLKNSATGISIVFSSLASLWFFEFRVSGNVSHASIARFWLRMHGLF